MKSENVGASDGILNWVFDSSWGNGFFSVSLMKTWNGSLFGFKRWLLCIECSAKSAERRLQWSWEWKLRKNGFLWWQSVVGSVLVEVLSPSDLKLFRKENHLYDDEMGFLVFLLIITVSSIIVVILFSWRLKFSLEHGKVFFLNQNPLWYCSFWTVLRLVLWENDFFLLVLAIEGEVGVSRE